MNRQKLLYSVLITLLFVLIFASICSGSIAIPLKEILKCIFNSSEVDASKVYIVRNLRIPKTLGAVLIGAGLAMSGLVFQTVFRNPMADSYILGLSSAASFSVCLCSLFGLNSFSLITQPLASFTGSVLCTLLLFLSEKRKPFELLLKGIALNFLLSSATTLLMFIDRQHMDKVIFWTMGSLNSMTWSKISILMPVIVLSFVFFEANNKALDILLLDDSTAISSGVSIDSKKIILTIAASITTSVCVAFAGIIGFVGLMSPHFVRLILGPKHKNLIALSVVAGADIMLLSEIIAKTVIAPSELPIGIVTSILGAPVLILLIRRRSSWVSR